MAIVFLNSGKIVTVNELVRDKMEYRGVYTNKKGETSRITIPIEAVEHVREKEDIDYNK